MKIAEIELDSINNQGGDNVISTNTAVSSSNDDSENEIVTEEEMLPMKTKDLKKSNITPTRNKTLIKNQKSQTETAIFFKCTSFAISTG